MTEAILIGAVFGIAAGIGAFFIVDYLKKKAFYASLELVLLLVKIPHNARVQEGEKKSDFKTEINLFEQLIANLSIIRKTFVFEVAVPHIGEEIHFYLALPRKMIEVAAKQIQGLWNGASVELVPEDYNIFNAAGATSAAYLLEKENFALPIRTYREIDADTFSSIVGAFTKVNEVGEGAALQLVVRRIGDDPKRKVHGFIHALKKGEPLKKVFGHEFPLKFSEVQHALSPKKEEEEKKERIVDEGALKALEAKISKPLFEVNLRLVASAPSQFQANDILDGMIAGFTQFGAPLRNEFRIIKPKNIKKLVHAFSFRTFDSSQAMILSSEEIASVYHFPTAFTETPKVKWLKAKEAPPPSTIPSRGLRLGVSSFRGEHKPVNITEEDRMRHIYVIGQTGTGKSTFLGNLIIQDIESGKGVALIDPHGDLAEKALGAIPKERIDDLIYFNPGDLERPLGLNMIEYNPARPEEKTFIVNEMQNIFYKLFVPETMGPMFEQYMRNALLLLMEDMQNEATTLVEVPRIFTDAEYRNRKLARIGNPVVIDFWEKEAVKAGGEASLANMTPYITSKFNNFIANDYMRPIIGQTHSAFNFREVMDQGKILLVNLSKGRLGDINANLLGMIITGKLLMAALSRVDLPQESRKDFNLYIDEFQNFTTDSIAIILSEARKYRLSLTAAHQFIAQLTDKVRDAVFGNVGSIVAFRVGVQDTEILVKQFAPVFDANDLVNIDNLNAYVKILINGETSKPFNIKIDTTSWNKGDREFAESLKEYSRLKYGMDRHEVEARIHRRLRE